MLAAITQIARSLYKCNSMSESVGYRHLDVEILNFRLNFRLNFHACPQSSFAHAHAHAHTHMHMGWVCTYVRVRVHVCVRVCVYVRISVCVWMRTICVRLTTKTFVFQASLRAMLQPRFGGSGVMRRPQVPLGHSIARWIQIVITLRGTHL